MQTLVVWISLIVAVMGAFPHKHLAGPPSEFNLHRIPDPSATLTETRSASQFLWFNQQSASGVVYTTTIPVDGMNEFVFSVSSPVISSLHFALTDPTGKEIDLQSIANEGFIPLGEEISVPTTTYVVAETVRGIYTLTISSDLPADIIKDLANSPYPNVVITAVNNDEYEIATHFSTYIIKQGKEVGIITTMVDESASSDINFHITSAVLEAITPQGQHEEIPMSDSFEGLAKFGYAPSTGIFGAQFTAASAGQYIVHAKVDGWFTDASSTNVPFQRTTQHVIDVSSATIELAGSASVRPLDHQHLAIDIEVSGTGDQLRAYAEVLGLDFFTKEEKPAAWVGGIVEVQNNIITLELDVNWLKLAGVTGPFTLQNVYVADLVTSFPVAAFSAPMAVRGSENVHIEPSLTQIEITKEMRFGVNPLKDLYEVWRNASAGPSLILLPGYCSSSNPFSTDRGSFTDAGFFEMTRGNYGHHAFATKVLEFIEPLNLPSFSLIGHSQGGPVAVHMCNYFFTGLDNVAGGHAIQSVGSPYVGCTAAGSLANLGQIFGVGCGSNNDLSIDGSKTWLAGINADCRALVHFYTTTYEQGNFFGDYCNLAINLILQWPNDGTTEVKFAPLPNAVNEGNTQKQCHISGMKYPPQTSDANRNQKMNREAGR